MNQQEFYEEAIRLLRSIDAKLSTAPAAKPAPVGAKPAAEVADDYDLDGKFGDEEIRKMPSAKYWTGLDYTAAKMSETSPDFLEAYARYKDACAYMNEKAADPAKAKYITYDRKSAARARGWALRFKSGVIKAPSIPSTEDEGVPETLPF